MQTAMAYGLSRVGFDVVVADIEVDTRERVASKLRSLGTKLYDHTTSLYEASWIMSRLVISDKLYHAHFCHNRKIRFAEFCGNVTHSQEIVADALQGKFPATVFRNLGIVPDWADRMKRIEADAHWTKIQKVLGFPAAAAAACFAYGHFNQSKNLVSYEDIASSSYKNYLDIIEGRKSVWRGEGYDE